MCRLLKNDRGAAAIEFALVSLPVILFTFGIMQTAWIVWANNLLNVAVDTAVRCGAIQSTTAPCMGSDMVSTANQVFGPLSGAIFTANSSPCSGDGGAGIVGSYTINIGFVVSLTLTAKSCYPISS